MPRRPCQQTISAAFRWSNSSCSGLETHCLVEDGGDKKEAKKLKKLSSFRWNSCGEP